MAIPFSLRAPKENLRALIVIRAIVLGLLLIASACSYWLLNLNLHYVQVLCALSLMLAINLFSLWRLKKRWPITEPELLAQLISDLLVFGWLLYATGGANNPFVSYLLVPVSIAAATLQGRYAWLISLLALLGYSALLFWYQPLPELAPSHAHHGHSDGNINLHVWGMWLNFIVSALLICGFVVKMAKSLRDQRNQLNQMREDELRDEQLIAIAQLAAGTAHELGTPLSTVKILLGELCQDYQDQPQLHEDLTLLQQQIELCSQSLKQLARRADNQDQDFDHLHEQLNKIIERWQVLKPQVKADFQIEPSLKNYACLDVSLEQALLNLLNNAAEASPNSVSVCASLKDNLLHILIEDRGPGIDHELAEKIGQPFIGTGEKGFGLGLFLSRASIDRCGGQVLLQPRSGGGTVTDITLPVTRSNNLSSSQSIYSSSNPSSL